MLKQMYLPKSSKLSLQTWITSHRFSQLLDKIKLFCKKENNCIQVSEHLKHAKSLTTSKNLDIYKNAVLSRKPRQRALLIISKCSLYGFCLCFTQNSRLVLLHGAAHDMP